MTPSSGGHPAQVNIRLERAEADVLAAIAFLEGAPQAEILRQPIRAYLKKRRSEAAVQDALRALAAHRTDK